MVDSCYIIFKYRDDDGLLNLSKMQKANFGSWKRPSQIMKEPKMVAMISSAAIKQVKSIIIKRFFNYLK